MEQHCKLLYKILRGYIGIPEPGGRRETLQKRSVTQRNLTHLLRSLKLRHRRKQLRCANQARGCLHHLHQILGKPYESHPNRCRQGRCAHCLSPSRNHCEHRNFQHRRHINGRAPQISQISGIINGTAHQNDDNVPHESPGRRTNGRPRQRSMQRTGGEV